MAKLSERDFVTITNGLRVAAERYRDNAAEMAKLPKQYHALAVQFETQAVEALELADRISAEEGV